MSEAAENVVWLDGAKVATAGVPVETVCGCAAEACQEVVVIGWTKAEGEIYIASSFADAYAEKTLWAIEKGKRYLLKLGEDE